MSNADTTTEQLPPREAEEENPVDSSSSSDESSSDSDSSDEEEASAPPDAPRTLIPPTMDELLDEYPNTRETNIELMTDILDSDWYKKEQEREERKIIPHEDRFDFPKDPENWREEGLKELWADAPVEMTKPGWDPNWVDEEEVEVVNEEIKAGRDPPIQPFYVPYRKPYPVIPNDHYDIYNAKSVIEELDRIEEFLVWVSHVFEDGSTYEGTVWDDLAHGKGVYVAEQGLVRYEGEWLQNNPEGHGVIEVDIPDVEPVPGSKLEEEMRAEGRIIKRDFMSPEDREWLEMDIEDSIRLARGISEIPFYENDLWMTQFGSKPEKGRYRYAGQWKHGRMHGCGVYEVNERPIFGRFYFGQLLEEDTYGCDANISAMHSGIAEVAAAKARMFVNKPDGMVREERGPYSDPQHPYFYEEEDVWMAPGFINQFYEVPDYWKRYVSEVDEERQMWLNSFYKAPLRLPMPPELQYWWENDEKPEFVLINKEPEPDPEDPSKLIYTEDPLILHTPTGRVINYVDDEEHGIRLFWQPPLKDGEDVDPEKAIFLPLGFDEFFGRDDSDLKDNIWMRAITGIENAFKPFLEKVEKWTEEKKKAGELEMQLIEKEYELEEAESTLEEVIQDMDEELKRMQEEEEKKVEKEVQEEEEESKEQAATELEKTESNQEEDDEEEDEEDAPSSFGSVTKPDSTDKESKNEKSPFAAASLSSAPKLVSAVPTNLLRSFSSWNKGLKFQQSQNSSSSSLAVSKKSIGLQQTSLLCSVSFPRQNWSLRPIKRMYHRQVIKPITNKFRTRKYSKREYSQSCDWVCSGSREEDRNMLLSLHTPYW